MVATASGGVMCLARMTWEPTVLSEIPPSERVACSDEVVVGLDGPKARAEALRCLHCPRPSCQEGCPNENPIRDVLALIAEGRMKEAAELKWTTNALPACTGRVCPWEEQCEGFCVLNNRDAPIRIGAVERFLGDWALEHMDQLDLGVPEEGYPERVAVVGAGPGGLACTHFLRRLGYGVTVYDAWYTAGGVMDYGIPEFVLPKRVIQAEEKRLRRMGVEFRYGIRIGREITLDQLRQEYDAVFLSVGANEPRSLSIEGSDLQGVWTAKEFLQAYSIWVKLGQWTDQGGHRNGAAGESMQTVSGRTPSPFIDIEASCRDARVIVVGAGNTAMDAARAAVRLGAEEVRVVYRRSEAESPSRAVEVEHAKREGVGFAYLVNPTRFIGESGRLKQVELVRMELGEVDESGRPRPRPVPGSEFRIDVDVVVLALGYEIEDDAVKDDPDIKRDRRGRLVVDTETFATSREGVFSGGDCVTGPKTVSSATAAGKKAAYGIHRYLRQKAR